MVDDNGDDDVGNGVESNPTQAASCAGRDAPDGTASFSFILPQKRREGTPQWPTFSLSLLGNIVDVQLAVVVVVPVENMKYKR